MSPLLVGLIGFVLLFVLLFLVRIPIGIGMGLIGFLGFSYLNGIDAGFTVLKTVPFRMTANYTLTVVPLFILMGDFAFHSGMSYELYNTVYKWLGRLPGGLAMATIGACAAFAAISGSSPATAATMGKVAYPEMKKYKYDDRLATGCIAAGGTLGILIPPSIVFIIYGVLVEESIGKLFISGIFPGILLTILFMIAIYVTVRRDPRMAPMAPTVGLRERLLAIKGVWAVAILFLLVMGGIYMGIFTPTEAAAVGAFGAAVISLIRRRLSWRSFTTALLTTGRATGMIFVIVIGAMIFSYFLAVTRLPFELAEIIGALPLPAHLILVVILIFYLALGCVMDALAMVLITVPIFFPVAMALGFDPIWFGVIVVIVCEMALITPPIGQNVFILSGIVREVPLFTIFRGIFPFLLAMFVGLALIIAFPQIALFLPNLMK